MSSPRFPERDLRLERLPDRDGLRPAYGEAAQIASPFATTKHTQATLEALIDAVFTAPGAAEWLHTLSLAVAALVARKAVTPLDPARQEAIRSAEADPKRGA